MCSRRLRTTATAYTLLAPSLFGVAVFLLLPMFVVAWQSLHRWDLLGPISFVGLDNWRAVLTDGTFGNSLLVTAAFVALVVPVQTALGLVAASLLARQLPGSVFFRTVHFDEMFLGRLGVERTLAQGQAVANAAAER
jgi:multiple sugar transport system permease protein